MLCLGLKQVISTETKLLNVLNSISNSIDSRLHILMELAELARKKGIMLYYLCIPNAPSVWGQGRLQSSFYIANLYTSMYACMFLVFIITAATFFGRRIDGLP